MPALRPAQPFGAGGGEPNTVDAGIDGVGSGADVVPVEVFEAIVRVGAPVRVEVTVAVLVSTSHPVSDRAPTMQITTRQFMIPPQPSVLKRPRSASILTRCPYRRREAHTESALRDRWEHQVA